jgi:NADH-quinone oxidoreductase subunit J
MDEALVPILKVVVVVASLVVAFSPNVLYAAFSLLVTFFGVAIFYAMAGADFLAGAQVIVYIGGILVVIMFAIMLSHRIYKIPLRAQFVRGGGAALVGFGLFAVLWSVHGQFPWERFQKETLPPAESSLNLIGNGLLKEYVLPFEAISVLLLVALIGGMVMSRPTEREVKANGES